MLLISIVAIFAIINGFTLKVLWGWFIVPHFGVNPLTIPVAIGISLVVTMLTSNTPAKTDERYREVLIREVGHNSIMVAYVLAVGWITSHFV